MSENLKQNATAIAIKGEIVPQGSLNYRYLFTSK